MSSNPVGECETVGDMPTSPSTEILAVSPPPKLWTVGTLTYTAAGLSAVFFWLLWGDFSLTLKDRSVPPTLQLLLESLKVSNAQLGLLLGSLPQCLGMIIAPIIAYRSDRHRGPLGRRIPFLIKFTPSDPHGLRQIKVLIMAM